MDPRVDFAKTRRCLSVFACGTGVNRQAADPNERTTLVGYHRKGFEVTKAECPPPVTERTNHIALPQRWPGPIAGSNDCQTNIRANPSVSSILKFSAETARPCDPLEALLAHKNHRVPQICCLYFIVLLRDSHDFLFFGELLLRSG